VATGGFNASDITTDTLHHAFIAEPYGGLKILDISNPSSPTLVGHYEPDEAVQDVAVSNNRAYLLCDADMVILDVSNISTPKVMGKTSFSDTLNSALLGHLAIFDSIVYAVRTSKYLYAIDVSNSSLPIIKSVKQTNGYPLSIAKAGNYIYVANSDAGIQVFNAMEPENLIQSAIINVGTLRGLYIEGEELFALTECGFTQYEILDSTNFKLVGCCALPPGMSSGQIKSNNGFAYLCFNDYFLIINISNLSGPSVIYTYEDPYGCNSFAQFDNFTLLGRNGNSLLVLKSDLVTEAQNKLNTPQTFILYQNYPNPFNPTTVISYQLPANTLVTLKVYDELGRLVKTLLEDRQTAGTHSVTFSASSLSSGVYFYRLTAGSFIETKKLMVIK
jgi:hypothetical protein